MEIYNIPGHSSPRLRRRRVVNLSCRKAGRPSLRFFIEFTEPHRLLHPTYGQKSTDRFIAEKLVGRVLFQ